MKPLEFSISVMSHSVLAIPVKLFSITPRAQQAAGCRETEERNIVITMLRMEDFLREKLKAIN